MAKITLLGCVEYFELKGEDFFSELNINSYVNKEALIENILYQGGEFPILVASPEYLRYKVGQWCAKWQNAIDKWCEALQIKYDPLNNYDRTEEWTTTDDSQGTSHDVSHSTGSGDTTNTVSAYNVNDFSNDSKDATTSQADTTSDTTMTNSNTNVRRGRAFGNVGVTTSQQMLESELNVVEWNLINKITEKFLDEFCIQVYL